MMDRQKMSLKQLIMQIVLEAQLCRALEGLFPRGSIYTTIMELGAKNNVEDGLLGPNSIMVVYVDPLGLYMGQRK